MADYGSKSTAGYGTAGSGQLRGSVYGVWPEDAWVYSITGYLGRTPSGGSPSVRMGLYTTENTHPYNLVGQTAAFTVSNAMDWGGGSQAYTRNFSGGALRVSKGGNYAIGIVGTGASLNHAMVHAANSPFTNRNLYYRNGVTGSLPSRFGYTSSSYEGNISAFVSYQPNRAPSASTSTPNGLQTSTSVTFSGSFSDSDATYGDRMSAYEIELWNSSSRIWTTGWRAATSTEAQNSRFSYTTTVSSGQNLRWRVRVRDRFNLASAWTAFRAFNVHLNRAPSAATSVPNGLQTSTSVNFQGTFSDADTPITGDSFSRFQFQVRNDNSGGTAYDSGELVPNSTEVSNKRFSRNVSLTAGIPYSWRTRVRDNHGSWSSYTTWRTFTINAGGAVDTLSGVSGKQNTQQPTPFSMYWRHANGLNATHVQYRILQNGSVIKTGGELSSSRAPNASWTTAWATAFGSYSLGWGLKNLTWQGRAKDSAGVWSNWSSQRAFHINSAPNLPTNLTPANSAASPDLPLLRTKAVDDDGDAPTVKARIKNNSGNVLTTRTMNYVGDGWYEYQTTSADLADWGTYRWDARSFDGVLWTGTQSSETNAQHSSEAVFIYADVPSVVVTSPVPSETYAGSVDVVWNAITNQQAWRIVAVDVETDEQVTTGAWNTNTNTSFTLTAAGYGLRKGRSYSVFVELRDTNGLVGTSDPISFVIDYPAPSAIEQFVALPEFVGVEAKPSSIRITWQPYENEDFQRYIITRLIEGVPTVLTVITNAYEAEFTDFVPPSDIEVEYSIVLVTMQGLDELFSEPSTSLASIEIEEVVLQSIVNPTQHLTLRFMEDREFEHVDDGVEVLAWGAESPTMVYGTASYQRINATFLLITDEHITSRHQLEALRNLKRSNETICYRDERGRRLFGHIRSFTELDSRIGNYEVDLEIVQTQYQEGVE